MARKTPRRPDTRPTLESFTNRELTEVVFFGALQSDPYTVTFRATLEQRRECQRILAERKAAIPDELRHPPDPRAVLPEPTEASKAEQEAKVAEWEARRRAWLEDDPPPAAA